MFIGTNVYGWKQIALREEREYDRPRAMADAAAAGVTGWEDLFRSPDAVAQVVADAKAAGLEMRSAYVCGSFHTAERAKMSTDTALEIVGTLIPCGVTKFISNPDPLPGGALKSDDALRLQRDAFELLGHRVKEMGAELLYHAHEPEMLGSAREYHHMLAATDPEAVGLCLDVHWVWRGAGNSMVALEDIIRLYAGRVSELHLRQSHDGIWAESVEDGDLDLVRVAELLFERDVKALVVLEHAYEKDTPVTRETIEAHAASRSYAAAKFAKIAL